MKKSYTYYRTITGSGEGYKEVSKEEVEKDFANETPRVRKEMNRLHKWGSNRTMLALYHAEEK